MLLESGRREIAFPKEPAECGCCESGRYCLVFIQLQFDVMSFLVSTLTLLSRPQSCSAVSFYSKCVSKMVAMEAEAEEKAQREFNAVTQNLHHLVSTKVNAGIYNSPYSFDGPVTVNGIPVEDHINSGKTKGGSVAHMHALTLSFSLMNDERVVKKKERAGTAPMRAKAHAISKAHPQVFRKC